MNNWWEDLDMSEELKAFHEEEVSRMNIPDWAILVCPFCNEQLTFRSVRSIALMLNARNIGDVAVEFCCDKCQKMDTVYFRKAAVDAEQFSDLVNPVCDDDRPRMEPVLEEKMYKMQYNNLVEKKILTKEN
jgi:uncharacterized protein YbaR (Trm112 family)